MLTTRGPSFALLLPTLFCPRQRQRLSGLPPALAPARLPQAPGACTCSQLPPSGWGHPRAPGYGSRGLLTFTCTPFVPHSGKVTAAPNAEGSRRHRSREERKQRQGGEVIFFYNWNCVCPLLRKVVPTGTKVRAKYWLKIGCLCAEWLWERKYVGLVPTPGRVCMGGVFSSTCAL